MKYLRLFETQEQYDEVSYKLDYPCISVIEEIEDDVRYEEEPSWVKCVYEIPQEAFTRENSTVTIMRNAKGYIKAYKVNGEMADIEPERIIEGVQVDVFGEIIQNNSTVYAPTVDACPLGSELTTATTFTLSRALKDDDMVAGCLYDGNMIASFEPLGTVGELKSQQVFEMYYRFIDDTTYSYAQTIIDEMSAINPNNGVGMFFVDASFDTTAMPSLVTTMISSQVIGGINKINATSDMLDENNIVTIEYKLHDNVTLIDGHFNNVNYLKEIDFSRLSSRREHSIGKFAFEHNGSIEKIVFNTSSITSMEWRPFGYCTNLSSLDLNGLTQLPSQAFINCTSLTSVTIPETITNFDPDMFSYCSGLTEMTFSAYYKKSIERYDFNDIKNIQKLNILGGVTSIRTQAFANYTNLNEIIIGNSVTSIESSAFTRCTSLSSITIPDSVTSIGSSAFSGCTSLPVIDNIRYADTCLVGVVDNTLNTYTIKQDTRFIANNAFKNCHALTSITIPNSVTKIYEQAFENCSALTSVALGESVTSIGSHAFDNCSSLTIITIPDSVISIGTYAFMNCTSLTSVTIPDSVTYIGIATFSHCNSLSSITIPNNVTNIGDSTFSNCTSLTSVTIPNNVTNIGGSAFKDCSGLTSVIIPDSVTEIDNSAFNGCTNLTSIVIPDSVTTIGASAFTRCGNLTSIVIPDSVTTIGASAFEDCSELKTVEIGGVASLGLSVFGSCPQLTNVIIGSGITNIHFQAFYMSSELTSIIVDSNNPKYDSRENCNAIIEKANNCLYIGCKETRIPDSVTSIDMYAFQSCKNLPIIDNIRYVDTCLIEAADTTLTNYSIKDGTRFIYSSAFNFCSNLSSITIPNSVIEINSAAFADCSLLTNVVLGDSVELIQMEAFRGCTNLSCITSYAQVAPKLSTWRLFEKISSNGVLYCPIGSDYSEWKKALPSGWTIQGVDFSQTE